MTEDELIVHFFQLDGNLIIYVDDTFCLLRESYDLRDSIILMERILVIDKVNSGMQKQEKEL
jgi:hypothetical protein